jgi:hypothetical protein
MLQPAGFLARADDHQKFFRSDPFAIGLGLHATACHFHHQRPFLAVADIHSGPG